MPTLTPVDPANATGEVKEIFDGPLKGKHLNIFKGMANSPATLKSYLQLSGALAGGLFDAKEREVIQLVSAETNGCGYCLAAHTAIAKGAGLSEQQTIDARQGTLPGDAKLDALARFTQALLEKKGYPSKGDLDAFTGAGYTLAHAAEVVPNLALAFLTNYFNHFNDTPVDFPAAPSL